MSYCPAPSPTLGVVRGLSGAVDCHVQGFVHDGYATLFGRNLFSSPLFTAVLTIGVAVLGYRMLLARGSVRLGEAPMLALKFGVVLALATSWASYQTVVFDLAVHGPEEVGAKLRGLVLSPRSVFTRDALDGLQAAFDQITGAAAQMAGKGGAAGGAAKALQGGPALGAWALWVSAAVLLLSSLGVLLVSKVALGLLLALGPAFIGAALFGPTRGFAVGWLRATFAFAFAPLATTVFLTFLFALMEPSLLAVAKARQAGDFQLAPVITLTVLVLVFAPAFLVAMKLGADLAAGLSLSWPGRTGDAGRASDLAAAAAASARPRTASAPRDRAEGVAQAAATLQAFRDRAPAVAGGERRLALVSAGALPAPSAAGPGAPARGAAPYRRLGEASGTHRFQRRSK